MCDVSAMGGGAPQKIAQTATQVAGANGGATPTQAPDKTSLVAGASGGGAVAAANSVGLDGIGPVLSQLTQVITGLTNVMKSSVGGVAGGGAAAPAAPAKAAEPAAPAKTAEQTPPAKTPVAGGGATDAAAGASALLPVLTQLIEVIKQLAAALTAQGTGVAGATGGGAAPMKTVEQAPTKVGGENGGGVVQQAPQKIVDPAPTKVAGEHGGGVEQAPGKVGGKHGHGVGQAPQKLDTLPTGPFFTNMPTVTGPISQVGGATGAGIAFPAAPGVAPQKYATQVGGEFGGGVVQQFAPGKIIGGGATDPFGGAFDPFDPFHDGLDHVTVRPAPAFNANNPDHVAFKAQADQAGHTFAQEWDLSPMSRGYGDLTGYGATTAVAGVFGGGAVSALQAQLDDQLAQVGQLGRPFQYTQPIFQTAVAGVYGAGAPQKYETTQVGGYYGGGVVQQAPQKFGSDVGGVWGPPAKATEAVPAAAAAAGSSSTTAGGATTAATVPGAPALPPATPAGDVVNA
ncbi:MAG: hypothetical protein JWN72_2544 [Thermoleophilia bacterium]|nr:hypothetical protein [Thermoleophilia bacterium]